jgi:ABC-2 type transport system permease protein
MSSITLDPHTRLAPAARHKVTWRGILQSEWYRLVTTRSTAVTLAVGGIIMALFGMIAATVASSDPGESFGPPGLESAGPLESTLAGQTPVQLLIAVLGVMLGARDYSTGFVRTTYAAVPHRWKVFLGRLLMFGAAATVVLGAGTAVAFVAGSAILESRDLPTVAITDEGVFRALVGTAGYLVGIGLMGVSLGTITRAIGSGVGIVIGAILVLPGLGQLLIPDDYTDLLYYLPSNAGTSIGTIDPVDPYLSVGAGAIVFVAWLLGCAALALNRLTTKDV